MTKYADVIALIGLLILTAGVYLASGLASALIVDGAVVFAFGVLLAVRGVNADSR